MYSVQSNHSPWPGEIEHGWATISSSRAGHQVFDTLEEAIRTLEFNASLSRCIWPMRVVDHQGHVYRVYDPYQDMRLPGIRRQKIQQEAYLLWEKAGQPVSDGREFWEQAESALEESNGIE